MKDEALKHCRTKIPKTAINSLQEIKSTHFRKEEKEVSNGYTNLNSDTTREKSKNGDIIRAFVHSENRTNNDLAENSENLVSNLRNDVNYQSLGESTQNKIPNNMMTIIPKKNINWLEEDKSINSIATKNCTTRDQSDNDANIRDVQSQNRIYNDLSKHSENQEEHDMDIDSNATSKQSKNNTRIDPREIINHSSNDLKENPIKHLTTKIFVLRLEDPIVEMYDPEKGKDQNKHLPNNSLFVILSTT